MMSKELQNYVEWLNVNKLSLNVKKTQFMVFFSSRKFVPVVSNLVINNSPITRIYTAKLLGVFIDDRLTLKNHLQHMKSKISRGLGVLCKARTVLNSVTPPTLYYTFIYPYISYCIEIWGSAVIIHIASNFKKRAMRIIKSAPYKHHTAPIFKELPVLPISNVYMYNVIIMMYKYNCNNLPNLFNDFFEKNSNKHSYGTRQQNKLHVPIVRMVKTNNSFKFRGVLLWNYMYNIINLNCSLYVYKKSIKSFLIDNESEMKIICHS